MSDQTNDLRSIGNLAATWRVPVHRLAELGQKLNVAPAFTINGIPHYNGEQQEKLAEALRTHGTQSLSRF